MLTHRAYKKLRREKRLNRNNSSGNYGVACNKWVAPLPSVALDPGCECCALASKVKWKKPVKGPAWHNWERPTAAAPLYQSNREKCCTLVCPLVPLLKPDREDVVPKVGSEDHWGTSPQRQIYSDCIIGLVCNKLCNLGLHGCFTSHQCYWEPEYLSSLNETT